MLEAREKCYNISHACGEIHSIIYTNSYEAFINSYSKGYRNIEIDLLILEKIHIVAAHDWRLFKNITNFNKGDKLNIDYVRKAKIKNKYHIIYDDIIYKLLNKYNDVIIFTDKITDYNLLTKYGKIIKRLYVEVFTYSQYLAAKSYRFGKVMLNIKTENNLKTLLTILKTNNSIDAITIRPIIFYSFKNVLSSLYKRKIKIYAYEVYNTTHIKKALCNYISGFYID